MSRIVGVLAVLVVLLLGWVFFRRATIGPGWSICPGNVVVVEVQTPLSDVVKARGGDELLTRLCNPNIIIARDLAPRSAITVPHLIRGILAILWVVAIVLLIFGLAVT